MVLEYWFSVSLEEQRKRFEARNAEPLKRRKLSDMDLAEHELYVRCIHHLLSQFDYEDVAPDVVDLPEMREEPYVRPPIHEQTFVPQLF